PTPDPGTAEGGDEEGGEDTGDNTGDDNGDVTTQADDVEAEPVSPEEPGDVEEEPHGEFLYYMVEALPGAQDKSTYLRVTLANGMQAIAQIDVVRGDLNDGLVAITEYRRSFQRQSDDTVMFKLSYPGLVDDYKLSYEFVLDPESVLDYTYTYKDPSSGDVSEVSTRPLRDGDDQFRQTRYFVSNDTLGIIYTAPRLAGKAVCRVTLSHPDPSLAGQSVSAEVPIYVCPSLSPGFEVDGKRPLAGEPNPSNIKQTMLFQTIDINSTFDLGLCIGVEGGWAEDICRAMACHDEGWFRWEVDGSSVVVEEDYIDTNYKGGFVPYLRVRSGAREGLSVITYYTPFWTCVCNLQVENYNVSHPVDEIIFMDINENEIDEVTFELGRNGDVNIKVMPEASFEFHIPTVTVADPSICEFLGHGEGYSYSFRPVSEGTTVATATALDKTRNITIHVVDVCRSITWKSYSSEAVSGSSFELSAVVRLSSGMSNTKPLTWTCSNPDIVEWSVKADDPNTIVVKATGAGEVSFTAAYGDVVSEPATINIAAATDIEISDEAEWQVSIAEGVYFFFDANGDDSFTLPIDVEENDFDAVAGHFSGSDAEAEFTSSFSDCEYDLTITFDGGTYDDGDLLWHISGTLTLPNGTKVIFNNIPLTCGD
ncbi:MAG: hypothetical protein K2K79_08555, partial [Paramuribaculum sp.]|nr:hypothetical protein [Paramuribaculum sp.]